MDIVSQTVHNDDKYLQQHYAAHLCLLAYSSASIPLHHNIPQIPTSIHPQQDPNRLEKCISSCYGTAPWKSYHTYCMDQNLVMLEVSPQNWCSVSYTVSAGDTVYESLIRQLFHHTEDQSSWIDGQLRVPGCPSNEPWWIGIAVHLTISATSGGTHLWPNPRLAPFSAA